MGDVEFTVDAPKNFFNQDLEMTIRRALHRHAQSLGAMENVAIEQRTPVETSALRNSETFEVSNDPTDDLLVYLFADPTEQIAVWKREYDLYVEGGSIGAPPGFSNHVQDVQMFAQVETTDLPQIEAWGFFAINDALDEIELCQGVPL